MTPACAYVISLRGMLGMGGAVHAMNRTKGVKALQKPKENPFKPRSMRWALIEEDWSDLTVHQIAEVFATKETVIYSAMRVIHKKTGYWVPHMRAEKAGCKK